MNLFRLTLALVTAVLVLLPTHTNAQEESMPLTWIGMVKVKPGTNIQFENTFEKYDKPLFDRLVADGKAHSWGLGYELAGPGGFDYILWINAPGWTGIGDVESAFDTRYDALLEDEAETMIAEKVAAIEPGSEQTQLLRHLLVEAKPDADNRYLRLSFHKVKPGHETDFVEMYRIVLVPIYNQLLETGIIGAYGMMEQAVHSDSSFTHLAWFEFTSLADLDKVEKAIEDADAEVSEDDRAARKIAYQELLEPHAHYCRLIRVWMHGG